MCMNRFRTLPALMLTPFLICLAADSVAADKPPKIFTTDAVIAATIEAPWREITRARENRTWKGQFKYAGANGPVSLPVGISLRGLTRRRVCDHPPLRIAFDKESARGTEFRGAGKLKMVTHCFRSTRYAQYYIKEYLSYKMYNLVTPMSFRVQGLDVSYVDTADNDEPMDRFAFLIEDPDDVAKRNDLKRLNIDRTIPGHLDPQVTSGFMLFQYLVSNLDWSVLSGPSGRCCHNARIIGASKEADVLFPVPYDLDASGLVNTHYAAPPDNLRVRDVKQRLFRGFCAHNEAVPAALEEFRALREDILGLVAKEPRLDNRNRKSALRFIEGFYADLETEKDVRKRLIDNCRG